ncbi:hypothetical protein LLH23_08850 [bacterium]|nr:hypothetical protein [bacterium]
MPETPVRRDLLQIAIEAMHRIPRAEDDLDWFICWRIRIWERARALMLYRRGLEAAYGRFDVHRWGSICCRVRNNLYAWLSETVRKRASERTLLDEDVESFFADLDILVCRECEQHYRVLRREVDERGVEFFRELPRGLRQFHEAAADQAEALDSTGNMERGALLGRYLL